MLASNAPEKNASHPKKATRAAMPSSIVKAYSDTRSHQHEVKVQPSYDLEHAQTSPDYIDKNSKRRSRVTRRGQPRRKLPTWSVVSRLPSEFARRMDETDMASNGPHQGSPSHSSISLPSPPAYPGSLMMIHDHFDGSLTEWQARHGTGSQGTCIFAQ